VAVNACGVLVALVTLFPILWMVSTAFKPAREIFSLTPHPLPAHPTLANFGLVMSGSVIGYPFWRFVANSLIVTLAAVLASSLLSLQKPEAALDHLQKAMALNPANEITWYRLSQVQKALGNVAEQRKTMAEYRRLHDRTQQQSDLDPIFSPREATKQEVDANAAQ